MRTQSLHPNVAPPGSVLGYASAVTGVVWLDAAAKRFRPDKYMGRIKGILPEAAPDGPEDLERRRYYAQIPNIVVDMDLSPAAVLFYVYYKRAAGKSQIRRNYEGAKRLAKRLSLSDNTILRARRELEDRGLIVVNRAVYNGTHCFAVTLLDVWDDNCRLYEHRTEHRRWPA